MFLVLDPLGASFGMTLELEKAKALKKRLRRRRRRSWRHRSSLNDPAVVEILGDVGFDVLVIDAEHSPHGPENMQAMLQAGLASDAVVLARPLRLDPDLIRLYLDLGSPGVICPFIETRAEAELLVSACRYPPSGTRGYGPRRAGRYGAEASDLILRSVQMIPMLCIPIIESRSEAVENIPDGRSSSRSTEPYRAPSVSDPVDLSISLAVRRWSYESPEFARGVYATRQAHRVHATESRWARAPTSIEHARAPVAWQGVGFLLTLGRRPEHSRPARHMTMDALR